jgi:hypothetical protein
MPFAIQDSDRSPLHDVRNHACHFIEKFCMRNCICFADGACGAGRARLRSSSFAAAAFALDRLAEPKLAERAKAGGARRDRTDDLLLAKQALSQLSYGP